jgi:hypothetical protein
VTEGTLLIPNLGAEEGDGWRKALRQPAPASVARLWSLLFSEESSSEPAEAMAAWPPGLPPRRGAAFSWLESEPGAVAWISSDDAANCARKHGRELSGPSPDIVWRVHDKAFALRAAQSAALVPRPLRELSGTFEPEELRDADAAISRIRRRLESWPDWVGGQFALKPRLGTSGRGRVPGDAGRIDEAAVRGALPRLAARGGALLEPWLARTQDLSVQLQLSADGQLTLLGTLEQRLSPAGLYQGHRGVVDWRGRVSSGSTHEPALLEAGSELARAAAAEGFYGPCGLDAFVFAMPSGEEASREILRPVVEFNARFTTGTVVVGLVRRALPALELRPGDTRPFEFVLDGRASSASASARVFHLGGEDDALRPELRVG